MLKAGCLALTPSQAGRRDFLKAGSLGFLGIHLSQFLAVRSAVAQPPGFSAESIALLRLAQGITRQSLIKVWIFERLKEEAR